MNLRFLCLISLAAVILSGCAAKLPKHYTDKSTAPQKAIIFYQYLKEVTAKNKNANAIGSPVKGFPYLRSNRFLTHLKSSLQTPEQKKQWVSHLRNYDIEARISEIETLTNDAFQSILGALELPPQTTRKTLISRLDVYSRQLLAHDSHHPDFYETLIQTVDSPDDYSTVMRVLGLYPLAYWPVTYFTQRAYDRMRAWHEKTPEQLAIKGKLIQYTPRTTSPKSRRSIGEIFTNIPKDALGIHTFDQFDFLPIVEYYAPIYKQDNVDSNDIPGTVVWEGKKVSINHQTPSVYYYFSYAIINQTPLLQINYVNWYSARKGPIVPWYEEGHLDGFNFRVTLGLNGFPVMVDMVHNCGCYHFFAPPGQVLSSQELPDDKLAQQVVTRVPDQFPKKRILIRTNSGWHQIEHIGVEESSTNTAIKKKYDLLPYRELERLKMSSGKRESIFNSDGIVKGTQRPEPYLLFPMGIPEIGAMRQRTRQPTRLLGREHFDNPLIFENYFKFDPAFLKELNNF